MRLISPLLIGALVALASSAHAQPDPATAQGGLRGFLFTSDGRPVAGAVVTAEGADTTETGPEGMFYLRLSAGAHVLILRAAGRPALRTSPLPVLEGQDTELMVVYRDGGEPEVDVEAPEEARAADTSSHAVALGRVSGVVLDEAKRGPVEGARVFVRGARVEARTDARGRFELMLPLGEQELTIIHPGFATATLRVEGVAEREGLAEAEVLLKSRAIEVAELVVTTPRLEGGAVFVLEERKASSNVAEVLGADQISKAGDSDAAAALGRVTGVTVVGGRFVYVRGLGERYSTTLLNGSTLPSPDPERRVVPLDLFPAGVISSLTVQKTFSPDLPGEFGGGVVMIKTRDIPEETQAHLSISTGYRSATTFRTATGYEGGATDFLGFGLPERRLAQEIRDVAGEAIIQPADSIFDPTSGVPADQLERLGEQLDLRFPLRDVTVAPPFGITGDVGGKLALGRDVKVGGALGASYGQSWFLEDGRRETYQWGDAPDQQNRLDVLQLQRQVDLSAILNLGLDVGEHHQVRYTGFLSRLSSDETADVSGFSAERNSDIRITRLRWVEQMLFDNQLRGTHGLLDEHLQVDWRYVVSVATRDEPNRRQAQYNYEERGEVWTLDPDNYQRFDSELFDTNHDGGLDLTVPLQLFGGVETKVKVGGAAEYKKRNVKTRRYTFDEATSNAAIVRFMKTRPIEHLFEDDTIAPDRWQLEEVTLPSDNYDGEQTLVAGYGMVDLGILANLRVLVGARVELFRLKVGTRNPIAAPGSGEVSTDLDALDVMPGVTATWSFREDMQLRLAASRTVNRPNFREVSPAQFRDVAKSLINEGNPDLENARITHLDLRWEWYPDAGESVSLAVFAKLFEDPIELTAQPSSNLIFVPDNVEAARNIGVELEFRKGFGFLWEALEDLYAAGNLSVVTSRVDVGDKGGVLTETQRPLQGQSPYALNLQVGYENVDWGTTASVLFNVFGRRIDKVGALGQPSIYEEPVPTLDLVVGQRVAERVKLSFKWQNILDPAVRFSQTQASSGESRDFYRYRRGFTVGVGASISLE